MTAGSATTWQAIGALGQWMAAMATVIAIVVALEPNKKRVGLSSSQGYIIGGASNIPVINIRVSNTGLRKVVIDGVEIGIGNIRVFMLEGIISYPHDLEPGSSFSVQFEVAKLLTVLAKEKDTLKGTDKVTIIAKDACGKEYKKQVTKHFGSWKSILERAIT